MKTMRTRYKVLIALMAAVTVILAATLVRSVWHYYHPISELDAIFGFSLKTRIFVCGLYFIPVYAGTWLLWLLSVGLADWLRDRSR